MTNRRMRDRLCYVVQDSTTAITLVEVVDGIERQSYMGRRRTLDEIKDVEEWCSEQGIPFFRTVEALEAAEAARARVVSNTAGRPRAGDARTRPGVQRNAPAGQRPTGGGMYHFKRPSASPEQRELATV